MKISNATIASAYACPPICVAAYPKLLISGSTTVAPSLDNVATGWGPYIAPFMNVSVMNLAVPYSSTRQIYGSAPWQRLISLVSPGDFVVIEFGGDDEGDPLARNVTKRPTLPGIGSETLNVTLRNGNVTKNEVVHTFGWYLKNLIVDVREKNANPILSSLIPKNWVTEPQPAGTKVVGNVTKSVLQTDYKFRDYAEAVAQELKVDFVDHTTYSLRALKELGPVEAKGLYAKQSKVIKGSTFTNSKGGKLFAETFVQALRCSGSDLADYLNEDGLAVDAVIC